LYRKEDEGETSTRSRRSRGVEELQEQGKKRTRGHGDALTRGKMTRGRAEALTRGKV
jgi:hypothetical protein